MRELGRLLYDRVSIRGEAQWLRTTWNIQKLDIREVHQLKRKKASDLLSELRDAGASDWDHIDDPATYLNEVAG
jgi:hypothetical protein